MKITSDYTISYGAPMEDGHYESIQETFPTRDSADKRFQELVDLNNKYGYKFTTLVKHYE